MKSLAALTLALLAAAGARAQAPTYPPLAQYLMPRDSEVTLARSAAPAAITSHATIKLLTAAGFQVASTGDNGFTCVVMRGPSAPTYTPVQFRNFVYDAALRAPICFDPNAARTVLPYYELRTTLAMAGKNPDEIAIAVEHAYESGKLPKRAPVSFAYMLSPHQMLGQGIGSWRPHMMIFAPGYANATVGGNAFGSSLPQLSDDAGTPFAVVVIPVDGGATQ